MTTEQDNEIQTSFEDIEAGQDQEDDAAEPQDQEGGAGAAIATTEALEMAESMEINLEEVEGSGEGGLITAEDIHKYLAAKEAEGKGKDVEEPPETEDIPDAEEIEEKAEAQLPHFQRSLNAMAEQMGAVEGGK
jgi:pyruvate/2-oxoglutarate dehydrogenase complex dihydrolipoamide acyltransferase (E2) component